LFRRASSPELLFSALRQLGPKISNIVSLLQNLCAPAFVGNFVGNFVEKWPIATTFSDKVCDKVTDKTTFATASLA
jgi:hypothetical protein